MEYESQEWAKEFPGLGVFQDIWDAWDSVEQRVMELSEGSHLKIVQHQLHEILGASDRQSELNEIVDIISVSLNWLRWHGLNTADIAALVQKRNSQRYVGKTTEIMDKYAAMGM